MPEPEASANDQEPRVSQPQEPSHDKVLVDAIGYTKGLVALLDSLTEGFQRRGRELDDQRARLAILQSERRTILQERAEFDARITALTAERDKLRTVLETRENELTALRQGTAQTQTALESRAQEIEVLRAEADARIGVLVAERDSLRTTLETREREVGEQRARLATLDDERRTSLQERAEFDARIAALTAERDGLRGDLAEREQEIDRLRHAGASTRAALESRAQEIEVLRAEADARIGVLVAERDSLRTTLETRERELDNQRTRLASLDHERRTSLQERAEFDARITALTAERDGLRAALETRERDLGDLRQSAAQTQTALQARTREIEALRAEFDARITALTAERDGLRAALETRERDLGDLRQSAAQTQTALQARTREIEALRAVMAEPTRQAEELRDVVRSLERQLHRTGQLPARAPLAPASGESAPSAGGRAAPRLDAVTFDERVSEQRRAEDGRIDALTAERDALRGTLEEHEQEVKRLRQDVARGQAALEAQTREIQALRTGMAETVRQAEEIRTVLQALEQQVESAGRREAVLEEALEAERRQVREAAVRASQEHDALREDLADAENLLAEARKDIGTSQGVIASLRRTADEERAQGRALREQVEKQSADLVRLRATMEAVPTLLDEFVRAFGGGEVPSPQAPGIEDHEAGWLEALAQAPAAAHPEAEVLAILQTVRDAFRNVVPPAAGSDVRPPDIATDPTELRRRADQIADHWRRVVRKRGEPSRPAEPARQERGPVPEPGGPTIGDREVQPERAGRPSPPAAPSTPAGPSSAGPKSVKRPGPPSGMTVECTFPASETEAACILRGEIARINDMGLLAAFEERLPEGVSMVVRFVRDGEMLSCLGRVVRVQESAGTSAASATLHHLIRFESPVSAARENARSSAS